MVSNIPIEFYLILIICLHTVYRFKVLLFNIINSIYQVFLSKTNNFHIAV